MLYLYPCYFIVLIIWNQVDAKVKKKQRERLLVIWLFTIQKEKEERSKKSQKWKK